MIFSEKMLKVAGNFSRDNIVSMGTKFGRFNKNHKFRLHIMALDYLAKYAQVGFCGMELVVVQGVGEAECRDDLPLRKPYHEGRYGRWEWFM